MHTVEGRTRDLTSQQLQAVIHLLRTGDTTAAAEHVGVNVRTIRKWRALPAFRDALRQAGRDAAREAAARTMDLQNEALSTLVRAMRADRAPWHVRVQAAGRLLEHGRYVYDDDLAERLTDLERQAHRWTDGISNGVPTDWPQWARLDYVD